MFRNIKSWLLENRSLRQTVAKNTFWLGLSNIGGRLIRAVVIIYAARVLGAYNWGVFAYAINLVALVTIFTDLGIGPVVTRETSKYADERGQKLLATAFVTRSIFSILGALILAFAVPYITTIKESTALLPIIALVVIFDALREFGSALIRGLERMEMEAGLYLLTNTAIVLLGFTALKISPTPLSFGIAYAVGAGIGMIATIFTLKSRLWGAWHNFSVSLIKPILNLGWPFAISSFLGGLMVTTNIFILGIFWPADQVGIFSAADRFIQLLYLLPIVIASSVFPVLARLAGKDNQKFRSLLERVLAFAFLIGLPLAFGGFVVAEDLLGLFFGEGFKAAALPLQILLLTLIVRFPAGIFSNALFAFDKQKSLVAFSLIGGITNLAISLLLIPSYGPVGAALAALIAQALSNWYLWKAMRNTNEFRVLPHLKNIIAASIFMAALACLMSLSGFPVLVTVLLSAAFYLGLLALSKEPLLQKLGAILQFSA